MEYHQIHVYYTRQKLLGEIADDIVAIDQAMKWGFGWEQGPFEIWDAIGVEKSVEKMKEEGIAVPTWVKEMLEKGHTIILQKRKWRRLLLS